MSAALDPSAIPRLVLVPAWATPDGAWTAIRDGWPGPHEVFLGAGLDGSAPAEPWTLADDVERLTGVLRAADVLCGAGWAASTALFAARRRAVGLVVLYSPPLGIDLRGIAAEIGRDREAARRFMSSFGGSSAYWDAAVRVPTFADRVEAYLGQDVLAVAAGVGTPIVVVSPGSGGGALPAGWTARHGAAESLFDLVRDLVPGVPPSHDGSPRGPGA